MCEERLVWYASYGSNMFAARFSCYLQGGQLAGMSRPNPGARNRQPPQADRAIWLPGQIYFAGHSRTWGGGMAFLDQTRHDTAAGRAYLITVDQFADVVAQEQRQNPGSVLVDIDRLETTGSLLVGTGAYNNLVVADHLDGVPVVTFTSEDVRRPVTRPSAAYRNMLRDGLCETHGWDPATADRYLDSLPGAR